MASEPHPAIAGIHYAASARLAHTQLASTSFWRRWFEGSGERHALDDVRAFSDALGELLDVPPPMIRPAELKSVGEDVNRVVAWIEAWLEQPDHGDEGGPLSAAIYVIRLRHEELYSRGATKKD